MIRCDHCKLIHPHGTLYCGNCGGSLGNRICEHGHESPMSAHYCLTCGSKKLSTGIHATNLQPWLKVAAALIVVGIGAVFVPVIVDSASSFHAPNVSLDGVFQLIIVITLAAVFLGGKAGRKAVLRFYTGLLKFLVRALIEVVKSLIPSGGSHH